MRLSYEIEDAGDGREGYWRGSGRAWRSTTAMSLWLPNFQLQTVAEACGFDSKNHHHALADAEACAHIVIRIL